MATANDLTIIHSTRKIHNSLQLNNPTQLYFLPVHWHTRCSITMLIFSRDFCLFKAVCQKAA